jgi:hypothetical protein
MRYVFCLEVWRWWGYSMGFPYYEKVSYVVRWGYEGGDMRRV